MSNATPKRFSKPGALKSVNLFALHQLLEPHQAYLQNRGFELPELFGDNVPFDYDRLSEILMTPDESTPHDLAEVLYQIHEMSTPEAMERLLEEAEQAHLQLIFGEHPTPADIAVQVWLAAPDMLRELHTEQMLFRPRSFISYVTDATPIPELSLPSEETLNALGLSLDNWFQNKHRGRGTRVSVYERDGFFWFLVRHGEPFKREGSLRGEESDCVLYRPEKYDVVVYNPEYGELRINAPTPKIRDLYKDRFGLHLFNNSNFFPGTGKYTLDPLKEGPSCLVCQDVPGISSVKLTEIEFFRQGNLWERITHKAEDVFAVFEARDYTIHPNRIISRAKFKIRFSESRKERVVVVRPSNHAQYTQDEDASRVERWLSNRGFVLCEQESSDEAESVDSP